MATPRRILCRIVSIQHHDDVVSTILLRPNRRIPRFVAGQFLHLALDRYEPTEGFWPESRVFSITSTPAENEISLVYAVKGKFTRRMRSEMEEGQNVWIKLPYGHFTLSAKGSTEEVILVAGGTGIAPFISFIRNELHAPSTDLRLKLVYGVRTPELFLFKDDILQALSRLLKFEFVATCENRADSITEFLVKPGCLTLERIWQTADDPVQATFYLSGPFAMIQTFKKGLQGRGIPVRQICIDEWE